MLNTIEVKYINDGKENNTYKYEGKYLGLLDEVLNTNKKLSCIYQKLK